MAIPIQMRQLEISPSPPLLSVPCTNPNGPEFIDARQYFHQHLKWSLTLIGKSCDVPNGGLSERLVFARTYLPGNLASYFSMIGEAHGVNAAPFHGFWSYACSPQT